MAFSHGTNRVFKLDNSAGTLVDLSSYITSVTFPRSIESMETTTLGNTDKTYIPGLKDGTISIEGKWDSTLDAHMDGIMGKLVTFEDYPTGTGSGQVKRTGEALVTSYEQTGGVDSPNEWSAELQCSGAITRSTV
jgi:hypothetical protein